MCEVIPTLIYIITIECGIFGEGSQFSTNQKRDSTVFSLLICRNLRPFPDNVLGHPVPRLLDSSGHDGENLN